ncbi:peptidase inhibitor family I36 [Kribbella amoyensis]|uniref:Peptidase inhibitor family I36 n=1 Tax=Kribbella amoyensis TaxID=996641 RepID=A0A561C150_9ACTN|nr:peptidase inhibitor family I36 protein [Kribbella amoyensis]TWD84909.1 peptidase inhibitor family I36 [Kribbella amoyensis]
MNKFRSVAIGLTVSGLAAGSMLLSAGQAAADGPPTSSAKAWCWDGYFCAWKDADYKPTSGEAGRGRWEGSDTNWGIDINNKATSFWNNGTAGTFGDVRVYNGTGSDWGGSSFCLTRGSWWSDIRQAAPEGAGRPDLNDWGSSHRWVSSC